MNHLIHLLWQIINQCMPKTRCNWSFSSFGLVFWKTGCNWLQPVQLPVARNLNKKTGLDWTGLDFKTLQVYYNTFQTYRSDYFVFSLQFMCYDSTFSQNAHVVWWPKSAGRHPSLEGIDKYRHIAPFIMLLLAHGTYFTQLHSNTCYLLSMIVYWCCSLVCCRQTLSPLPSAVLQVDCWCPVVASERWLNWIPGHWRIQGGDKWSRA